MAIMMSTDIYNRWTGNTSTGNIGVKTGTISTASIATNKVEYNSMFKRAKIKNVIFNDPATIVFWSDGTKTVVKCGENDIYDPEKGLAMAVAKKYLGTNKSHSNYLNEFKKWLPKDEWHPDPFEDFRDNIKKLAGIGSSLKEKEHD